MSLPAPDALLRVVLFEPRIPPNTGNIARTCAAFQLPLALIEPLGFTINDRTLRRAGLDYWPHVQLSIHPDLTDLLRQMPRPYRLIGCSRHGGDSLSTFQFLPGDVLLFGREDTGLPDPVRQNCDRILTIPMPGGVDADGQGGVRSLNLSVACALVSYTAGHQLELW
ncbi:MAG: tRNA (cytidine(34)-2'-O)-methyltransferase [Cyanobacteria bacterium]|nr:rRNA methyltransferase [Cyanobium sp. MED843]MBL6803569.1 tRNA (cytidine(34)-2'-O)-methyltransferase [Synechococcus sp. BS307-5m-G38]MDA0258437.1 tRNA (cytidine(34)-2'-O)-methyltransferase [Cyanobacteriota bacterium]OUW29680.1 MAG: rRNA methyltransferase [Cyanobacteria bacterium TMED177]